VAGFLLVVTGALLGWSVSASNGLGLPGAMGRGPMTGWPSPSAGQTFPARGDSRVAYPGGMMGTRSIRPGQMMGRWASPWTAG